MLSRPPADIQLRLTDGPRYAFLGMTAKDGDGTSSGTALLKTGIVGQVDELP
jgi:hypothetical protein